MAVTATIRALFHAEQTSALDVASAAAEHEVSKIYNFTSGTGANQADMVWSDTRTLAASATEDLDLAGVLTDALGATFTAAEVVALIISAEAANTNNVVIGDATQPVPLFGGTNPTFAVKPGSVVQFVAPGAAGLFTVGAGATDDLKVTNSGAGTPVTYTIAILARTA